MVICYGSATLSDSERLWSTVEKECFAVVVSIVKNKQFLQGQKFTVYTDNIALTNLKNLHGTSKRLTKWSQFLQNWQCDIVHVPGKKNWLADCLSRAPLVEEIGHLEEPEESQTPIFSIAFVNNILELLKNEQQKDDECKLIVADLQRRRGTASSFQNYSLKDDILYRSIIPFENPEVVEAFTAQGV